MTSISLIRAARDTLLNITPMLNDCGKRCGAACCKPDADGQGGMILFPGEELLYQPCPSWASITKSSILIHEEPLFILTCNGHCERAERPLSCRIFPLTPYAKKDLQITLDVRAWPICPLMPSGIGGLSQAFCIAVQDTMRVLWQDDACRAYMLLLSELLDMYKNP